MRPSGVGTDRENRPASAGAAINHFSMRKVRQGKREGEKERRGARDCVRVLAHVNAFFFLIMSFIKNILLPS